MIFDHPYNTIRVLLSIHHKTHMLLSVAPSTLTPRTHAPRNQKPFRDISMFPIQPGVLFSRSPFPLSALAEVSSIAHIIARTCVHLYTACFAEVSGRRRLGESRRAHLTTFQIRMHMFEYGGYITSPGTASTRPAPFWAYLRRKRTESTAGTGFGRSGGGLNGPASSRWHPTTPPQHGLRPVAKVAKVLAVELSTR